MQPTHRAQAHATPLHKSDWYFIPTTLSSTAGVIIGFVIANFLGWV
jgi:hypothetical protein